MNAKRLTIDEAKTIVESELYRCIFWAREKAFQPDAPSTGDESIDEFNDLLITNLCWAHRLEINIEWIDKDVTKACEDAIATFNEEDSFNA